MISDKVAVLNNELWIPLHYCLLHSFANECIRLLCRGNVWFCNTLDTMNHSVICFYGHLGPLPFVYGACSLYNVCEIWKIVCRKELCLKCHVTEIIFYLILMFQMCYGHVVLNDIRDVLLVCAICFQTLQWVLWGKGENIPSVNTFVVLSV